MNFKQYILIVPVLLIGAGLAYLVLAKGKPETPVSSHGADASAEEPTKGPHGGRLLGEQEFQTEVTIYEPDIPPQSRVYFFENGKPIDPNLVQLTMELHRIDRSDIFKYQKEGDYLIGDKIVEEPHSFDVKVSAEYKGKSYQWEYESYEGRTELSQQAVKNAGLVVEAAGPATLRTTIRLNGKIVPNENRLVHIRLRFSGIVREIKKELGEKVQKNDVLAVIESNESLTDYEVQSNISGTVIQRNVSWGEVVSEGEDMFVVADMSTVWANFNVYRQDVSKLREGQTVILDGGTPDTSQVEATISYISAVSSEDTQTLICRAEIPNPNMHWRPGVYIVGEVIVSEREAPISVKASGLQTFRDWDVVFKQVGDLFEIAILELGSRDGEWVEVVSGLNPGTKYVTENSFVVKADVLKSGATHDH